MAGLAIRFPIAVITFGERLEETQMVREDIFFAC
jgi:hypothetical protein